ncbi:recombinase RecT [Fusobacterium necrophorum subsp. funduliforme]|uniref:recombinase RecT n=1 Tax=Fusobacterium necrophorum TaxID=859 RepID=UPI0007891D9A|nr:recombinase RecT [Fusobacterium necrophorum]KYM49755.1 recombinase RecT [Fusobacterium necrophorum subsp. funduliforme]
MEKTAKNSIIKSGATTVGQAKKPKTIFDVIQAGANQFAMALPKHLNSDRFVRIAITAVRQNPELLKCSQESLLGALMQSAQLGLEPGLLGQCYLLPFRNKKLGTVECQFQIGYKGKIELLRRTEQVSDIYAYAVHENDEFSITYGLDRNLTHTPAFNNQEGRGEVTGYYAVVVMKDGTKAFAYMTKQEIENHEAKYRLGQYQNPVWKKEFDAMAMKTVLNKCIQYLPISVEFLEKNRTDGNVFRINETLDDVEEVNVFANTDIYENEHEIIDEETGEIVDNSNIGRDDIAKGLFSK